jgi:hypothetical protein
MINLIATTISRIMGRKPVTVLLVNSPTGMDADEAEAGGIRYRRAPLENLDAFRARAAAEAQRRGALSIVFGEQRRTDQQARSS